MSKAQRGIKPLDAGARITYAGPPTANPPRGPKPPSPSDLKDINRAKSRLRGPRLACQTRGCHETLGYLSIGIDPHTGPNPILKLMVKAPTGPRGTTDDPNLVHRFVLTGSQSPEVFPGLAIIRDWTRTNYIEFECRLGHESRFTAEMLQARMRSTLPD